jgi:hypothetical protein
MKDRDLSTEIRADMWEERRLYRNLLRPYVQGAGWVGMFTCGLLSLALTWSRADEWGVLPLACLVVGGICGRYLFAAIMHGLLWWLFRNYRRGYKARYGRGIYDDDI